jgi:hypothetical protein
VPICKPSWSQGRPDLLKDSNPQAPQVIWKIEVRKDVHKLLANAFRRFCPVHRNDVRPHWCRFAVYHYQSVGFTLESLRFVLGPMNRTFMILVLLSKDDIVEAINSGLKTEMVLPRTFWLWTRNWSTSCYTRYMVAIKIHRFCMSTQHEPPKSLFCLMDWNHQPHVIPHQLLNSHL